jgi:putative ABC transport system substrate-binding protein
MRRREFMSLLSGAAAVSSLSWPLAAVAEKPRDSGQTYRLGVVSGAGRDAEIFRAFFNELRQFGVVEGQNLSVLPEGFGLRGGQFEVAVAAAVKAEPDAIVVSGDPAARLVQKATRTIPIVATSDDMVGAGLVRSLAHPDGNITGVSILAPELNGKRQDILMEAVPGLRRIAVLVDPANNRLTEVQALQDGARARGVELVVLSAGEAEQIAPAIDQAKASGATALNVLATPLFSFNRRIVIERAAATRLPAIHSWPEIAEEGGLIAYGPRLTTIYRQVARQVVKVLHRVEPPDIPVEQPTNFELIVNLQAAKAIGLNLPPLLVERADKVIE